MKTYHCQLKGAAASLTFSGLLVRHLALLTTLICLFSATFSPASAQGQGVELTTTLRWGGNSEGGVPFILYDPNDRTRLLGFETEIAEALAKQMGLEAQFVQNVWDILIPGLKRQLYDVVINGIEVTPERAQEVLFSVPYYVTYLQLVTPKGNPANLSDLESCKDRIIGTLRGSYAYDTLAHAGVTEIRSYENESTAYQDMQNGRLDGVLMDAPMSIYYAAFNPVFEFVGEPIGRIEYAMALRREDAALLAQINEALEALKANDSLRRIYDRWNLWNPLTAEAFKDHRPALEKPVMYTYWADTQKGARNWSERLRHYAGFMPALASAASVTIGVSLAAMAVAVVLGLLLAVARLFGPSWLRWLALCWIEFVRGTPVLIQLFLMFYGLPTLGIRLSPFMAGTLALGLNYSAYEAENYRAGLLAVPLQQTEGALALGMTRWQALRYVILPQALRVTLPPMTNDFIALLKDSSLVSIITLVDLTRAYGILATANYDYFGTGALVALIYLLLGWPFVRLSRVAERHMASSLSGPMPRGVKETVKAASYTQ